MCTMMPVVCRTSEDAGSRSFSILLVDTDMKGVSKAQPIETLHKGCANEVEFAFDNVRVPKDRLLGGVEGNGLKQVMGVLNEMRVAESARFLAAAELGFEMTVEYVKNRKAFGQRIIDFQNTQFGLASLKTELMVGRAYVDQCLARSQHLEGKVTPIESSAAKLWTSELEFRVLDQCLQFHGGMGYAHDMPISQLWTHARAHRILLGTSEIHRMAIGRSL